MTLLVTSARFPFALELIRKLGAAGERMVATDSYDAAPGLHSHFAWRHHVTPSPAHEPAAFIESIARVVAEEDVELIVPSFEEVFYLAHARERLGAPLLAPSFDALAELHGKATFVGLCRRLDLPAPKTIVAEDRASLGDAAAEIGEFLARPSFSRSGVQLFTNSGPRAGRLSLDDCDPTPENPWLVQEFVSGSDMCSYSVCHEGRVLLHCQYRIPVQLDDASGVQFQAVDPAPTLAIVERVAAGLELTGQLSFDYKQLDDGRLLMIECNPRATSGVSLTSDEDLRRALRGEPGEVDPALVPAGRRMQADLGIVNEVFAHGLPPLRGLHDLLRIRDIYLDKHDIVPALYGLVALRHDRATMRLVHDTHEEIAESVTDDVAWDGAPIPT